MLCFLFIFVGSSRSLAAQGDIKIGHLLGNALDIRFMKRVSLLSFISQISFMILQQAIGVC